MKTAVLKNDEFITEDRADITLDGRKGAIVKLLGCGLCGSDIVKLQHKLVPDGTVLGHEIVAQIIDIDSSTRFKKNDIIITSHHIPCGECIYCKNGNVSMCEHFKKTNLQPGGFSEFIFVSEEHLKNVAHLKPKNLTEIEASFYEPLACCIRAVKRTQLKKGDTALVIGLGSIGILMSQALKAMGVKVIGCDLIDERIQFLKALGISAFNSKDSDYTRQYIKLKTENYGADAVFMTSGADKTIDVALDTVRNGGKILVFASTPQNKGYANNEIYYRELTVLGSYSPSIDDLKDSLKLLESGRVNVSNISTVYEFDEIEQAVIDTVSNKILKAYIKFKG